MAKKKIRKIKLKREVSKELEFHDLLEDDLTKDELKQLYEETKERMKGHFFLDGGLCNASIFYRNLENKN